MLRKPQPLSPPLPTPHLSAATRWRCAASGRRSAGGDRTPLYVAEEPARWHRRTRCHSATAGGNWGYT
eukprot:gene24670-biopygen16438